MEKGERRAVDPRSDAELLVAIGHGPGALHEFYRRHVGRVMGFGSRRFRTPEDVADFTADVFVEVLAAAPRFDPERGEAVHWLFGIAANVARRYQRRQARAALTVARLRGRDLLAADDFDRIDAQIDASAALRAVHERLLDLPAAEAELVALVAVDGLSVQDAANALGLLPVTARVRMARARRRLRELPGVLAGPLAIVPPTLLTEESLP